MTSEVGFEVIDAEGGLGGSELLDEGVRNINHEHSQISGIVNRELIDVHEIFQPPELFSIPEVEFNLKTEAIIVNEFGESQAQVAAEEDNAGYFLGFEVAFDNNDNIEFVWDEFVPHSHLIDFSLDVIF